MDLFARFVASFFQVGDALELDTTTDADVVCWCQNVRGGFDGLSRSKSHLVDQVCCCGRGGCQNSPPWHNLTLVLTHSGSWNSS